MPAVELVLTQAVAADPEVAALLDAHQIEGEVIPTDLAGHPHLIRVRREPAQNDQHAQRHKRHMT